MGIWGLFGGGNGGSERRNWGLIGFNAVCGQTWHQALRFGAKKADLGSFGGQEMVIWDFGLKKGDFGSFEGQKMAMLDFGLKYGDFGGFWG